MKSDKELADEAEARRKLQKMGWLSVKCKSCKGSGHLMRGGHVFVCIECDGKGHIWESPME